uniref:Putative secreted protein n=1 Tax=Anopheles marajoara TaxID=58244 RepID=A0A2M4C6G4_9DIPT
MNFPLAVAQVVLIFFKAHNCSCGRSRALIWHLFACLPKESKKKWNRRRDSHRECVFSQAATQNNFTFNPRPRKCRYLARKVNHRRVVVYRGVHNYASAHKKGHPKGKVHRHSYTWRLPESRNGVECVNHLLSSGRAGGRDKTSRS